VIDANCSLDWGIHRFNPNNHLGDATLLIASVALC
jgi:hypothetical protein